MLSRRPCTTAGASASQRASQRQNGKNQEKTMNITLSLAPLVSLLAGILILIVPRLLNYIVALYLIIIGVIGLTGDIHILK
jgi:threonine/homoserine efflux transporter RhtA